MLKKNIYYVLKIEDLKDRKNKRFLILNTARYHNVSLGVGHREISTVFVHFKSGAHKEPHPKLFELFNF